MTQAEKTYIYLDISISFMIFLIPAFSAFVHSCLRLPRSSFAIYIRMTFAVLVVSIATHSAATMVQHFEYPLVYINTLRSIYNFSFCIVATSYSNAQIDYLKTILPHSEEVLSRLAFRLRVFFFVDMIISCITSFNPFFPPHIYEIVLLILSFSVSLTGFFDVIVNACLIYYAYGKIVRAPLIYQISFGMAWSTCMVLICAGLVVSIFVEKHINPYMASIVACTYAPTSYACLITVKNIFALRSTMKTSQRQKARISIRASAPQSPSNRASEANPRREIHIHFKVPPTPYPTPIGSIEHTEENFGTKG